MTTPDAARILARLSEAVVKILDGYEITESIRTSGGHVLALRYATAPDGVPVLMNYNIMTHGTFFLFALVLAVPDTKWRLRLKIGLIAGALIFTAQVARVVVFAFNHYGQHVRLDGEWVYPELVVYGLFYANRFFDVAANQIFPVTIWACLYFYLVWHRQFSVGGRCPHLPLFKELLPRVQSLSRRVIVEVQAQRRD